MITIIIKNNRLRVGGLIKGIKNKLLMMKNGKRQDIYILLIKLIILIKLITNEKK